MLQPVADTLETEYLVIARRYVSGDGETYLTGTQRGYLRALAVARGLAAVGWRCHVQPADPHDLETPDTVISPPGEASL